MRFDGDAVDKIVLGRWQEISLVWWGAFSRINSTFLFFQARKQWLVG